jgi:hypothetical protein
VAPLNYSDVFYSNKNTVLQANKSPRENLRDIFNGDRRMGGQMSTIQKPKRFGGSPIREDAEEEQDLTGLLEDERLGRRRDRARKANRRPGSGGRNYSDLDGPLSQTQQTSKLMGVSKWLGRVFEAKGGDG